MKTFVQIRFWKWLIQMRAELIEFMGDDLRVVNAARVSFDNESDWEDDEFEADPSGAFRLVYSQKLSERDQKLIKYLATHNHWSPFSHVMITMREIVPIFVARQRFKHMVGFTYNEVSRRYVDDVPEFYNPELWRGKPVNAKQGSSDELISWDDSGYHYERAVEVCLDSYTKMIEAGVAPEQARMVLPQSMYTSYYVTGSLAAWARAYKLRSDPHAQQEIRELAKQWNDIISEIPELTHSWRALTAT